MRLRSTALVLAFAMSGVNSRAAAQDISVRSHLDRTEIGVNQGFILSVVIEGVQRGGWNPDLPDISRFARFISSSTSQNMQVINGRVDASFTLSYRFQASQIGRFTIPPVTVRVEGQTYRTEPITLTVSERPPARTTRADGAAGKAGLAPDDVFLETTTDRTRVYTGQPVIVEYRIFTRVNISSYNVSELPSATGFWVEEFDGSQSRAQTVVRDGREYTTLLLRKVAVFPTSSGTKTLEPMTLNAEIRVRGRQRDPFGLGGSLFGRTETVPITSGPFSIEVIPLPTEGRPADFSGFVGSLRASASLDRREIETNEALTYTVRVTGDGNMRTLPELETNFPQDFEVFPPEISLRVDNEGGRIGGSKTYSYVLIPRSPGQRTIPPISISYFNPRTGHYERATSAPLGVEVTGDPLGALVASGRGRGAIRRFREDIRFIHISDPELRARNDALFESPVFWAVLLIPLVGLAGATSVRHHQDKLSGDVAYARHRGANRKARKRFHAARGLLSVDTRREFYAEVGNALQGFLGDKLNIPEAGFMTDQVGQQLADRNAPGGAVDELVDCLRICDRQRFAPSEAGEVEMRRFLKRAEKAMASIAEALN